MIKVVPNNIPIALKTFTGLMGLIDLMSTSLPALGKKYLKMKNNASANIDLT
jgi:hypothetical protein